ncbi:MAG TPA: pyridoxal-phosphate dependent enzyme [Chthonomonadaceae bacterium]|nr:pyridoxal-phosphate dependent enzyme [Chthonomonadaceae bacterium]
MSGYVRPTTVIHSSRLNALLGQEVVIASETFQETGSFKFRATWNLVNQVPHPAVIAASSGNFGQALARACQLTGKSCTVVMPETSAKVKIEAVRRYGARVDLINTETISRADRVAELQQEDPSAYIASAYDDEHVIRGNATLGRELARLDPLPDVVVVPIGGGGLASGVITGLNEAGANMEVVGAEPALANDAARSLRAGEIVRNLSEPQTIADGARTVSVGMLNWPILSRGLAGIVEVSEEQICQALRLLFSAANVKVEPTGALSIGALLADPERFRGRRVCCVLSGGNVDPDLYARLITG